LATKTILSNIFIIYPIYSQPKHINPVEAHACQQFVVFEKYYLTIQLFLLHLFKL